MKLFLDLDGTLARFNVRNALKRFDKEKGFFANLKAYKYIEVVNTLALTNDIYIISASPNEQADNDKIVWLKKYLPNIKDSNITLCRIGDNKGSIIKTKYQMTIDNNCYLLDDYTKNLTEWENLGGTGIKRLTSVADNSRKLWQGLEIKSLLELNKLFI